MLKEKVEKPFRPGHTHRSMADEALVARALKLCDDRQGGSSAPAAVDSEMQDSQHFTTHSISVVKELERRMKLNNVYRSLLDLIPYPGPLERDRCSIVGYAIRYIKELHSTVSKLEKQVEEEKRASKRQKAEDEDKPPHRCYENSSNGSCVRKSKDRDVYVRVTDDELTVKLIQRNGTNALLFAAKVLDELRLEPHRVTGGQSDEHGHSSFNFCIKIKEGSSVHACAIAARLIDAATPRCKL